MVTLLLRPPVLYLKIQHGHHPMAAYSPLELLRMRPVTLQDIADVLIANVKLPAHGAY
jgi:hypothetical protein